ncbi:hypothetical protein L7F22_040196 [Adiantum nelumboides]|nr:hypothetical protein [Adiantum nelumboides]
MQGLVSNPMYANIGMQRRFWGTQGQFGVSQGNLGMVGFSIPLVNMTPRQQEVTGQGVQMAPTGVSIMQIVSFDNLESMDKPKPYEKGGQSIQFDTFNGFDERTKAFSFLEQFDKAFAGRNFTEASKVKKAASFLKEIASVIEDDYIVFKRGGALSSGERVAIKKLTIGGQHAKQEFLNEVNLITSVQHKNLIKLLGCCVEGPERILVYEYLPNKSLDLFLSATGNRILNWSTRYGVILGMAKGLAYLHEESHTRIVHRDIKPSNVLLDDELNPVIADFGLARLVRDNATHVNTGVAGTIGYLAPEYVLHGALSEKVDVFSFGLVALEIVTGKQNVYSGLLRWAWENYRDEKVLDIVDERLGAAFSPEEAIRVVHVALLCTQENPKQRPTMSLITLWLSGSSGILEIPIRPTFLDYNDSTVPMSELNHQFISSSSTSSQSTNVFRGQEGSWISGGVQSLSDIIEPR